MVLAGGVCAPWDMFSSLQQADVKNENTVKPAFVVISIKGSSALSSHFFRIPKYCANEPVLRGRSPVLCSQFLSFPWVTPLISLTVLEFANSICLDPNEVAHLDLHCLDVIGCQVMMKS